MRLIKLTVAQLLLTTQVEASIGQYSVSELYNNLFSHGSQQSLVQSHSGKSKKAHVRPNIQLFLQFTDDIEDSIKADAGEAAAKASSAPQ